MRHVLMIADDVLCGRVVRGRALQATSLHDRVLTLLSLLIVFGLTYGTVMGTFGGLRGDRALQVVYSATKVPLLLVVTFLIALPSFFVLNSQLGLRGDFREVLAALLTTQAAVTIVL